MLRPAVDHAIRIEIGQFLRKPVIPNLIPPYDPTISAPQFRHRVTIIPRHYADRPRGPLPPEKDSHDAHRIILISANRPSHRGPISRIRGPSPRNRTGPHTFSPVPSKELR